MWIWWAHQNMWKNNQLQWRKPGGRIQNIPSIYYQRFSTKERKLWKPSQKCEGNNQPSKAKQIHNKEDNQETKQRIGWEGEVGQVPHNNWIIPKRWCSWSNFSQHKMVVETVNNNSTFWSSCWRTFSRMGLIMTKKRCSLEDQSLNMLMRVSFFKDPLNIEEVISSHAQLSTTKGEASWLFCRGCQ